MNGVRNILNRFYQTFSIYHSFYYPWLLISENVKDSSAPAIGTLDTQNTFLILGPLSYHYLPSKRFGCFSFAPA